VDVLGVTKPPAAIKGQRACHNACSGEKTLEIEFRKAFEMNEGEKSMKIDLSLTSKSWCSVLSVVLLIGSIDLLLVPPCLRATAYLYCVHGGTGRNSRS
jgi:hypothetical protein